MAIHADGWPDDVQLINNNLTNQFQLPVIFYVLVLVTLYLNNVTMATVALAWLFFIMRLGHMIEHITRNKVPVRLKLFSGSVVAVMGLLVLSFAKALTLL